MPLDPRAAGFVADHDAVRWDERDVMLYALSLRAGTDDLAHTTENTDGHPLEAYPWMPVLFCQPPAAVWAGIGSFDWSGLVHARQELEIHQPFPVAGAGRARTTVVGLYDKGTAAVVQTETVLRADDDRPLATGRGLTFIRGTGGWGGDRGPSVKPTEQAGPPQHVVSLPSDPHQALLYRINGDRNPLHSDPAFARTAGFDRPILHGLCTLGMALRSVLRVVSHGGEQRIASMSARFSRPAYPGDELTTSMWRDGDTVRFRTEAGSVTVLDDGAVVLG